MEFVYNPQVELTSVELQTLDDAVNLFENIVRDSAEEGKPFSSLEKEARVILNNLCDFTYKFVKEG